MNNGKNLKAVAYGEVLWDVFANEKKIGGAPLNVALRMKTLGCEVAMISCVGNDEDGNAIIDQVKSLGLETASIIKSEEFPTGLVNVTVNERGSASYEISYPSAWDKIVLNDFAKKKALDADVLIYGSLVCRDEVSRESLQQLLQTKAYKVFDVNLRKPHYSYEMLEQLMHSSDFIKFNDEELLEITKAMKSSFTSLEDNMYFIAERTKVTAMCVTRGKHGALLMWNGQIFENAGYPVEVADTVGAGDSFLAALITSLLTGKEPQKALNFACAVGALVAEAPGANPEISYSKIEDLMSKIKM
ncbi:carbohydrate kinase [Flavobacterium sp. Fl-77]|uniref:Carbohydrate kinase n=1 Tax=Flavobacterium flavipigmentatum TaxID=2893884 RepID=A0AAJ2SDT3_9FLAO|nr:MULTISPECIES: carbohydrate kinase [unclassified Flavobacterium]MDX6182799.1 carbohydrate kinase [Flavobacterium sp. Fl-33]MDX6186022.1 carbohydrate kinase [Flavobacterium sp. Fl-77]UFH38175.1 carbohydrate kinase [Flavobacterium sp. F-70]